MRYRISQILIWSLEIGLRGQDATRPANRARQARGVLWAMGELWQPSTSATNYMNFPRSSGLTYLCLYQSDNLPWNYLISFSLQSTLFRSSCFTIKVNKNEQNANILDCPFFLINCMKKGGPILHLSATWFSVALMSYETQTSCPNPITRDSFDPSFWQTRDRYRRQDSLIFAS